MLRSTISSGLSNFCNSTKAINAKCWKCSFWKNKIVPRRIFTRNRVTAVTMSRHLQVYRRLRQAQGLHKFRPTETPHKTTLELCSTVRLTKVLAKRLRRSQHSKSLSAKSSIKCLTRRPLSSKYLPSRRWDVRVKTVASGRTLWKRQCLRHTGAT